MIEDQTGDASRTPSAQAPTGRSASPRPLRRAAGLGVAGLVAVAVVVGGGAATADVGAHANAAETITVPVSDNPTQTLVVNASAGDTVQWQNAVPDRPISTQVSLLGIGLVSIEGVLRTDMSVSVDGQTLPLGPSGSVSSAVSYPDGGAHPYTVNYALRPEVTGSAAGIGLDLATNLLSTAVTAVPPAPAPGVVMVAAGPPADDGSAPPQPPQTEEPTPAPESTGEAPSNPGTGPGGVPTYTAPDQPAGTGSAASSAADPTGTAPSGQSAGSGAQGGSGGSGSGGSGSGGNSDSALGGSSSSSAAASATESSPGVRANVNGPLAGVLYGYGDEAPRGDSTDTDADGVPGPLLADMALPPIDEAADLGVPAMISIVLLVAVGAGLLRTYRPLPRPTGAHARPKPERGQHR